MNKRRGWLVLLLLGALWPALPGQVPGVEEFSTPSRLDVRHYQISVEVDPDRAFLKGEAKVQLRVLEDTRTLPFSLNKRLSALEITDEEGTFLSLNYDELNRGALRVQGEDLFQAGTEQTLTFRFEGALDREEYAFLDLPRTEKALITREGALLLSEGHWFPSHRLPLDAATVEIRARVPLGFSVVGPGQLQEIETVGIEEIFRWESAQPVTQVPLVVARYLRQRFDLPPVPVTFFVEEAYDRDLQPLAEAISQILDFYGREYAPAPISALTVAQVGDVELASTGCRGLLLLEGPLLQASAPPREELAKRLALQWWGYSARFQRPQDAWMQDGFATFAALRYFQETEPSRFETYLSQEAVQALKYEGKAPISGGLNLGVGSPQYRSLVASKGAWVLYMLGQLVGPDRLNGMLQQWYRQKEGEVMNTSEFAGFVQQQTGEDYRWFFVQWVESMGVPVFTLDYTVLKLKEGGFKIRGEVRQTLELFKMPLDLLIETKEQPEEKHLLINGKSTPFTFQTEHLPVRLEVDPKGKILRDSERMRVAVHIALGEQYREQGELIAAIEEYRKAVELNPRSSLAHYRLGEVYFEQHSYSNAANSLRDSLNGDLKPEWVETWVHIYLGKIYDILGQRQRALAEYQKAINSKIDYQGAQAEARKYLEEPYSKPSSVIGD